MAPLERVKESVDYYEGEDISSSEEEEGGGGFAASDEDLEMDEINGSGNEVCHYHSFIKR